VIFLIDTLRADRLGVYGDETARTPNIDALAQESALFENAHASAPWTLPSVVSLFTSTFPCEHGVLTDGDLLPESIPTLAEHLRDAGYATASAYGNPYAGPMSGLDRGFYRAEDRADSRAKTVGQTLDGLGGSPFFLYLHNAEPHDPYSEKLFIPEYQIDDLDRSIINQQLSKLRRLGRADFTAGREVGSTDNTRLQVNTMRGLQLRGEQIHKLYAKDVALADHRVGSVVAELKRRGVWDRTLFILLSDHGEEFGDHGEWQHDQSAYEELLRVPLLIHFPDGRFAGKRVTTAASLVDIVPTIAEELGLPQLATSARGRSLLPALRGDGPADNEARVTGMRMNRKKFYRPRKEQRGDINIAVRRGEWKAIYNVEHDAVELYDLERDPGELRDRAEDLPQEAGEMKELAREWYAACRPAGTADRAPGSPTPEDIERLRVLGYTD
jgi:arylsulfatase A-like enzyme